MDKNEILEKSRQENKDQDVYEKDVVKQGSAVGAMVAGVLATIFFIVQIFTGGGMNYGLYAVTFSILAGQFVVKAVKFKRKHEIAVAICYGIITLLFASVHIYNLIVSAS